MQPAEPGEAPCCWAVPAFLEPKRVLHRSAEPGEMKDVGTG